MRRTPIFASVLALGIVASAGAAHAVPDAPGTGTVVDVVAVTAVPGGLVLAGVGTGALTGLSDLTSEVTAGGGFGAPVGGSILAVTDARLNDLGWYVTATYTESALLDLGAENIKVKSAGATGSVSDAVLTAGLTGADADGFLPLTSPVTVAATPGEDTGAGITQFNTQYKVQIPIDAGGTAFTGIVTYTVASMR